jgi:hypothetical protein
MARPTPAPEGAVATSPRPQARPDNLGHAQPTMRERMNGFFPEQGSEAQYDMIMQLVQAGMANASASGSPLANLLAPIAGAAIGGRATRKREDTQTKQQSGMTSSVLGEAANNPDVQGYLEVLNNPDAPGYLKSIAQTKLDAIINPRPAAAPRTSRSSPRRSSPRSSSPSATPVSGQRTTRLYGNYEIGGVMHGRDNYGNMVPYVGPDGQPVRSSTSTPASTSSPAATPSIVDELTSLTTPTAPTPSAPAQPVQPALDASDPLGILNIPPA